MIRWEPALTAPLKPSDRSKNYSKLQQKNYQSQHPNHIFHEIPFLKGALHWASLMEGPHGSPRRLMNHPHEWL